MRGESITCEDGLIFPELWKMSEEDRQRWDRRYRDGAYESRTHPSAYLALRESLLMKGLPGSRALDVASGAGRNSLWLAQRGCDVTAVDISAVGLARLQRDAAGMQVRCIEHDLDAGLPMLPHRYDLVIKMRYLNLPLIPSLIDVLNDGGLLLCEVLLQGGMAEGEATAGPASPRFRAAPGQLLAAAQGLELIHYDEGPIVDPDGRTVFLARLTGRRC